MAHLAVFKGRDSVAQYFDPDNNPPLPLVEIPDRLNPFRQDGVRIYAKLLTALPAQNVKSLPALGMLLAEPPGVASKAIVEASSGSTVLSLGILSRVLWGNDNVTAHVTNKKHKDSLKWLRFFGLQVSLYGGLAQQEPTDPRGIMNRLRYLAKSDKDTCYPGQYDNANNWKSHERWTGPQIFRQLPEVNVFCTTVGTGGCITGTGSYLKAQKPSVTILGIFNSFGDPTPGPRHLYGFQSCGFPWKSTVDTHREVSSADSYRMSMRLSREGLIAGPSSGQALQGLLDYIGAAKADGTLCNLADSETGELSCVFTCSDLPYQYLDGYFAKLGENEFPPIHNEILLSCDQDRHDERWILDPQQALKLLSPVDSTSSQENLEVKDLSDPNIICSGHVLSKERRGLYKRLKKLLPCSSSPSKEYLACHRAHRKGQRPAEPLILDVRSPEDFFDGHIRGAHCVSLQGFSSETAGGDLFEDANAVHWAWTGLRELLGTTPASRIFEQAQKDGVDIIVLCYNGDVSSLATSILRSRGIAASSVLGGFNGFRGLCPVTTYESV